jgi:ubiquinone/menaquinone biosynthesis C-methylase UbiE
MTSHSDAIVDQFTRQADSFANAPAITDERALDLLVRSAGTTPGDVVLDVACGPGLVVCAFAAQASHATGIDLTPAMLERAQALQERMGLTNVSWRVGDGRAMPFPDREFDIVCCRFAFHHFPEPNGVLTEMVRACKPGGRIVVADVVASEDPAVATRLNAMDSLRDPSHVRFMPESELRALFHAEGLPEPAAQHYRLEGDLDALLGRSFPNPGDDTTIRQLFEDSLTDDGMGMDVRRDGELIRYGYPSAILVAPVPVTLARPRSFTA